MAKYFRKEECICKTCDKTYLKPPSIAKISKYCSRECKDADHRRKTKCVDCGRSLSKTQYVRCFRCSKIGENNNCWKGGRVKQIYERIRGINEYSNWRNKVFERDNHTCRHCGSMAGGTLRAHHITTIKEIVMKFNITDFVELIKLQEMWDINNGITLCEDCHIKEHGKERRAA